MKRFAAGAATIAASLAVLPLASAVPPSGAGPDTPGTSSSVSPSTVKQCESISYQVTGYPAGETLNVKIDDGAGYSDTSVHGSGVVTSQRISDDGTASGSVTIPCDMNPGSHWLRFLATEVVTDKEGKFIGTEGYTRRGGASFTVVAADSGTGGTAGGNSKPNSLGVEKLELNTEADQEYLKNLQGDGSDKQTNSNQSNNNSNASGNHSNSNSNRSNQQRTNTSGNSNNPDVTVTEVVEQNVVQGGGEGSNSNNNGGNSAPSSVQNTLAVDVPKAKTADKDKSESDNNASGDNDQTYQAAAATTVAQPYAQANNGAPIVGLYTGGSILIVGLLGIAAYLFVNRRQKA